jgi:hypothetical protein
MKVHKNSQKLTKIHKFSENYKKFCYYVMLCYDRRVDSNPLTHYPVGTVYPLKRLVVLPSEESGAFKQYALQWFFHDNHSMREPVPINSLPHCSKSFFLNLIHHYRIMQKIMANAVIPTDCGD